MKKIVLIICGCITLGIGVLGIVVPLLPTTPFLLLSGFCFYHSSPSLYRWLVTQKYIGQYIYCYKQHKAISQRSKVFTLVLLWSVIIISACTIPRLWITAVLVGTATAVTWYLVSLNKLTAQMIQEYKEFRKTFDL
ncbi:MAG: YbaN family protein [Sphaerochaetaceae bacterium]